MCRKETQSVTMKNPTTMPVTWRLVGFDTLGEEFTCTCQEGCVNAYSSVTVSLSFQPVRPVVLQKKFVKIEARLLRQLDKKAGRASVGGVLISLSRPLSP